LRPAPTLPSATWPPRQADPPPSPPATTPAMSPRGPFPLLSVASTAARLTGHRSDSILALASGSKALSKVPPPVTALVVPVGSKKGQSVLPMVGVVGNWMTSLVKGNTLFLPKFQALYGVSSSVRIAPSPPLLTRHMLKPFRLFPRRLEAASSSSNVSTSVVIPAVGAVAVALALVQFGLLDKGRLGVIGGLF
jgi:hypothetical protein